MKQVLSFLFGMFVLSPPAAALEVLPGVYDVAGIENDGERSYQDVVTITITAEGECQFDLGSPPDVMTGLCLIEGDTVSASSVMGGHWFGLYRATEDGVLRGTWRIEGETGVGTETLTLRK